MTPWLTARLTIDVTPTLRGDAAFRRGIAVADMLRGFLAREFPADPAEPSWMTTSRRRASFRHRTGAPSHSPMSR